VTTSASASTVIVDRAGSRRQGTGQQQ
jgi:hypothetical protein